MNKACLEIVYIVGLIHHLVAQNGYNYPPPKGKLNDNVEPAVLTTIAYVSQQSSFDSTSNEYHPPTIAHLSSVAPTTYPRRRPINAFSIGKPNGKANGKVQSKLSNDGYSSVDRSQFQSNNAQAYTGSHFPRNGFPTPQKPLQSSGLYEIPHQANNQFEVKHAHNAPNQYSTQQTNGISKQQPDPQLQTDVAYPSNTNLEQDKSQDSSDVLKESEQSEDGDYASIPGEPEKDYPIFSYVPTTSFRCDQQQFPGYYADIGTRCQIFHICANNRTYDFICPNGTIFHQKYLVCVWWNQFDCASAQDFFHINKNLFDYVFTEATKSEDFVTESLGKQEISQHSENNGFSERKQTDFRHVPLSSTAKPSNGYHSAQDQNVRYTPQRVSHDYLEHSHEHIPNTANGKFQDSNQGPSFLLTTVPSRQYLTPYPSDNLGSSISADDNRRIPGSETYQSGADPKFQNLPSSQKFDIGKQRYSKASRQKSNFIEGSTRYLTSTLRSRIDWDQDYNTVKQQTNGFVHQRKEQPVDHSYFNKDTEDTAFISEQSILPTTISPGYRLTENVIQGYQSDRPSTSFSFQHPDREYLPPYSK